MAKQTVRKNYTIVYLDAMYFKVRSNGKIVNKAVYLATMEIIEKRTQSIHNFGATLAELTLIFQQQLENELV